MIGIRRRRCAASVGPPLDDVGVRVDAVVQRHLRAGSAGRRAGRRGGRRRSRDPRTPTPPPASRRRTRPAATAGPKRCAALARQLLAEHVVVAVRAGGHAGGLGEGEPAVPSGRAARCRPPAAGRTRWRAWRSTRCALASSKAIGVSLMVTALDASRAGVREGRPCRRRRRAPSRWWPRPSGWPGTRSRPPPRRR